MVGARVVLLEDDLELARLVSVGLGEEGFEVVAVRTAKDVMALVAEAAPDVLIVDVGLPDADGRDVVQALRAEGVSAPVIFLTARDALPDRLAGFAAGGDDYLGKPFAFAELVARLRALVGRGGADLTVSRAGLRLDPAAHSASCGGVAVELSPTEFRLLVRLARAAGGSVRRRALIEAAWPYGAIVRDNTLDVYVARLRRKLRDLPDAPELATVHGVGYALR